MGALPRRRSGPGAVPLILELGHTFLRKSEALRRDEHDPRGLQTRRALKKKQTGSTWVLPVVDGLV